MGLITRLWSEPKQAEERAALRLSDLGAWGLGAPSNTGVRVTEESSLTYSAVWACIRIISESIASLPLHLMRSEGRNRFQATEHPVYSLLHDLPNAEQTAYEFRQMVFSQTLLWGTGFAEKEYNKRGQVVALWPLLSSQMEASERRAGGRFWAYRLPDNTVKWIHQDYLHIVRGLSGDGVWGYSPIKVAALEAVGLGLATEEFGGRFFGNGAHLGGILEHPGRLSPEAHLRLRNSISDNHGGLSQSHRLKILEEGMSYKQTTIPPDAAQFLETRKFQVNEIARIFRVPPHMMADLERATFSNVEHLGQEFVTYTLRPWLVGHEQAIYRDMLDTAERGRYFARYNVNGLLRGDIVARYSAYSSAIAAGFMTRNQARELEDWNPLDGLDTPLVPLNMVEEGAQPPDATVSRETLPQATEKRAAYETRQERTRVFNRFVRLFEESAGRLARREIADIERAVVKYLERAGDVAGFRAWLAEFYAGLASAVPGYFESLLRTYAEQVFESVGEELGTPAPVLDGESNDWFAAYLENFAQRYVLTGEGVVAGDLNRAAEEEGDAEGAALRVRERMEKWTESKAAQTGLDQAFEAGNALAILGYLQRDVQVVVWEGGDCPLCAKLNGTRQTIGEPFVTEGDTVEPDDDTTAPLAVKRTLRHGPLHGGCDCTVRAG